MALFENKVITHYLADTTQEQAAIEGLIRKNDQLKKAEAAAAKEREQHFDQLVLDLTRASRAEDGMAKTQVAHTAAAKKSFGEVAGDLARLNLVFGDLDKISGFAVKSLGLLGAEMSSVAKETVNAAAKGAQMGAAFGPLGAAIGAAGGALGEFTANLYDNGRTELTIKSYEAMVYQSERLSAIYKQISQDLDNWTSSIEKQRYEQEKANRALLDSATGSLASAKALADDRVNTLKVAYLTEKRFVETYGGSKDQLLLIARQLRDAQTEQSLSFKSYGEDVIKIREEEQHRFDAVANLNSALADGVITQKQYQKALADLNKEENAAAKQKAAEAAKIGGKLLGYKNESSVDRALREGAADRAARQADIDRDVYAQTSIENSQRSHDYSQDRYAVADAVREAQEAVEQLDKNRQQRDKTLLEAAFGPLEQLDLYREGIEALGGATAAFTAGWQTSLQALGDGHLTAAGAFKKGLGVMVSGIGDYLAAESAKELVTAAAMAITLNPMAGPHAIAGGIYGAGAVAAYATAAKLGASGGGSSHASPGGSGGGGGSSGSGGSRGNGSQEIVHTGGTGTRAELGNKTVIVYADPFADGTPGTRRRSAKKALDRARGGRDWEDS